MPVLDCKHVRFLSLGDELSFFEWIKRIKCISRFEGVGFSVLLHIPRKDISDQSLRDLIALFHRYQIRNSSQLAVFLRPRNKAWFYENAEAYWRKRIFGK